MEEGVMIVIVDNSQQENFFLLLKISLAFWGRSAHTNTHLHPSTHKQVVLLTLLLTADILLDVELT